MTPYASPGGPQERPNPVPASRWVPGLRPAVLDRLSALPPAPRHNRDCPETCPHWDGLIADLEYRKDHE